MTWPGERRVGHVSVRLICAVKPFAAHTAAPSWPLPSGISCDGCTGVAEHDVRAAHEVGRVLFEAIADPGGRRRRLHCRRQRHDQPRQPSDQPRRSAASVSLPRHPAPPRRTRLTGRATIAPGSEQVKRFTRCFACLRFPCGPFWPVGAFKIGGLGVSVTQEAARLPGAADPRVRGDVAGRAADHRRGTRGARRAGRRDGRVRRRRGVRRERSRLSSDDCRRLTQPGADLAAGELLLAHVTRARWRGFSRR